ncbi:EAL domain-containing protein [Exiguobacterium marinum]|uniref:EAL domain-containing protein n=1 Tax=Exiguobacterium marinum TaxID=273528 RepID=A0ABY7WZH9_9BACL|nr:EAL domain-containing protein [Exiguobacterium marinum]WDH75284.1 EAL domain-containing protein [Exiguobacterium marinum]
MMKVGRKLIEQVSGLMVIEVNLSSESFFFSSQVSSFLGIPRSRLNGMTITEVRETVHPDDWERLVQTVQRLRKTEKETDFAMKIRLRHQMTSEDLSVAVRGAISLDRNVVTYMIFLPQNQQRIEHELTDKSELLRRICEATDTAICDYNFDAHQIEFATGQFQTIFGYTVKQFNAHPDYWKVVINQEDLEKVNQANEQIRHSTPLKLEYRIFVGKKQKWIQEHRQHLYDSTGRVRGCQILIRDLTEMRDQEVELLRLTEFDPSTNLPKRETMFESITRLIQTDIAFVLFTVTFNRIGDINRTFGYEYGDEWRIQTANRLQQIVPDEAVVGHLDGDTFLMYMPGSYGDGQLFQIGEEITTLSKQYIQLDPYSVYPNVRVGVSRYPNDATDEAILIRCSYMAMGRAGKEGANPVSLYTSNMNLDELKRFELLRDLPGAIERNEFFLLYQPKVNAWTGEITGAEALMRWEHPTWGVVSPLDFIPLAEESNLFIRLTDYLIEEVFRYLATLPKKVPISLNVSPKYLYHEQLLHTFESASERYGVSLHWIEIEVAETSQLDEPHHIVNIFSDLRALGIQLALDDFGKGYSSLAYLQQFQVNTIKIDRIFGDGVSENNQARAIIHSLVVLAKEFGLEVVVEGIEQMNDLLLLRQLDCKIIQGYLFSPPVRGEDFQEMMRCGTLVPDSIDDHETSENRYIQAGITISTLRKQPVSVGLSSIVLTSRSGEEIYFYAALRLPLDGKVEFVIRFTSGADLPVRLCRMTEVTNGLYQYAAEYESSPTVEEQLTSLETEVIGDVATLDYMKLVRQPERS